MIGYEYECPENGVCGRKEAVIVSDGMGVRMVASYAPSCIYRRHIGLRYN